VAAIVAAVGRAAAAAAGAVGNGSDEEGVVKLGCGFAALVASYDCISDGPIYHFNEPPHVEYPLFDPVSFAGTVNDK
jgi:hypothetical protein